MSALSTTPSRMWAATSLCKWISALVVILCISRHAVHSAADQGAYAQISSGSKPSRCTPTIPRPADGARSSLGREPPADAVGEAVEHAVQLLAERHVALRRGQSAI